jgi:hypothetical protein
VVDIVIPLGGIGSRTAAVGSLEIPRLIPVVFQNKVYMTIGCKRTSDGIG